MEIEHLFYLLNGKGRKRVLKKKKKLLLEKVKSEMEPDALLEDDEYILGFFASLYKITKLIPDKDI